MTYNTKNTKRKIYSAGKIANVVTLIVLLMFVLYVLIHALFNIYTAMDYEDYKGGIKYEVNSGIVTFHATAPIEYCSYSGGLLYNTESDYYDMENGIEYRSWYIESKAALRGKMFNVEENVRVSDYSLSVNGDTLYFGDTKLLENTAETEDRVELRINRVYYKNSDGSLVLLWSLDGDVPETDTETDADTGK